ncbi:hypothetical protein Vafri_16788 [Volvox africanus]|uniref:Uncharacterized protein n=1 Tax=Volvox africanus TaxID=51714 RepID=A0A8J4F729_9CHLO|nr:hypothetical protein Vafri_16788 [Volvox africanus]
MEDSSGGCCTSKEEKDAADAARFGLPDPRELHDDPVLAGCCEEDLQNMRRAEALRTTLLAADRSTVRLKLQQQALHTPQQQQQQQQQWDPAMDDFDELDIDDDDGVAESLSGSHQGRGIRAGTGNENPNERTQCLWAKAGCQCLWA